jgi:hypothetical protein
MVTIISPSRNAKHFNVKFISEHSHLKAIRKECLLLLMVFLQHQTDRAAQLSGNALDWYFGGTRLESWSRTGNPDLTLLVIILSHSGQSKRLGHEPFVPIYLSSNNQTPHSLHIDRIVSTPPAPKQIKSKTISTWMKFRTAAVPNSVQFLVGNDGKILRTIGLLDFVYSPVF